MLVLLIISGVLSIGKFPRDQIFITFVSVSPAVPLLRALVHYPDNFVEEFRNLGFESFSNIDERVDLNDEEDRVDPMPRYHNL